MGRPKTVSIKASETPPLEISRIIRCDLTGKFAVGYLRFLTERRGGIFEKERVRPAWKRYKPYGDLIVCLYDLLKEVFTHDNFAPSISFNRWFFASITDLIHLEKNSTLSYKLAADVWLETSKELKSGVSFHNLSIQKTFTNDNAMPVLGFLIAYCQILADREYWFDRTYWAPFLKCMANLSEIKKSKDVAEYYFELSGKIYQKVPKTRHKVIVGYLPEMSIELLMRLYVND